MPTYKLTYFPVRGLAEVSRQLFALSGTKYEDVRISMDEWPEFKSKTPFGQLPFLEVDGKPLPQSFAIARYLAKEFGYAGKNAWEAAWVDALGDQFKDYSNEIRPYFMALRHGEGDLTKLLKEVAEPARDKFFGLLEKQLAASKSGFLVGASLTWIDLVLADQVITYEGKMGANYLKAFPKVKAHQAKIYGLPKIKEWVAARPVSEY